MPNIQSAKKRQRQTVKKTLRNKHHRSTLRTFEKKTLEAIENGADNAEELFLQAQKLTDRAASTGHLHPNTAARRVARMQRALNNMNK